MGRYITDILSVEGTELSAFKLYNGFKYDMAYVKQRFSEVRGLDLAIAHDMDGENYIVIDNTELIHNRYSVKISDGNITVKGSYKTIGYAIEYFLGEFLDSHGSKACLTAADSIECELDAVKLYSKEELRRVLMNVYRDKEHTLIGHRLDTDHGYTGIKAPSDGKIMVSEYLEYFRGYTGTYPAMLYIDLSASGFQIYDPEADGDALFFGKKHTTDAELSQIMCELVDYCSRGGMVDFDTHFANPTPPRADGDPNNRDTLYGYPTWSLSRGSIAGFTGRLNEEKKNTFSYYIYEPLDASEYDKAFRDLVTEGTQINANFKRELDVNARFFKALRDNGIAAVYRPLHEMNGNWFWWCNIQGPHGAVVSKDSYVNLWRYIYRYYTDILGFDNLLWSYCPNAYSTYFTSATYSYPGDDFVDMVCLDWYPNSADPNGYALYVKQSAEMRAEHIYDPAHSDYMDLMELASEKIGGGLAEFGPGPALTAQGGIEAQSKLFSARDAMKMIKNLSANGYDFAYVRFYGNTWSLTTLGYADEFMRDPFALDLRASAELFENLK